MLRMTQRVAALLMCGALAIVCAPRAQSQVIAAAPLGNTEFPVGTIASYASISLIGSSSGSAGSGGAMIVPSSDAPPGTIMTAVATPSFGSNLSGTTIETFKFSFNRDVTFNGFPTFKASIPAGTKPSPPYVVEIHDGTSDRLLGIMQSLNSAVDFRGDPGVPFKAFRNRPYYANVVANATYVLAQGIPTHAASVVLPSLDGIRASIDLPDAEIRKNAGAGFDVVVSRIPATGLPPLSGTDIETPIYYASATVLGTEWYKGLAAAVVKIILPPAFLSGKKTYSLAAYDSGFAHAGWLYGIRPVEQKGAAFTFVLPMPHFIAFRQYGFALYASAKPAPHPFRLASPSSAIAVVGDSLSYLTVIPPSRSGCSFGWGLPPDCQYSTDPSVEWPGILARITGRSVLNLSRNGATTIVNAFFGPSMLGLQVPQISPDTKVVVCEWGDADMGLAGPDLPKYPDRLSGRSALMTQAILKRAPRARLIYIGIHCGGDKNGPACYPPGIAAWREEDKRLAAKYGGAYVDLTEVGKDGMNEDFPDGGHLSLTGARKLAEKVAERIHQLEY